MGVTAYSKKLTMRILSIDDDLEILGAIRRILALEGYEVVTASSAAEGVRLAQEVRPDLVLCDIMMPDHSGRWVIEQLRQTPETAETPVILLTGETSPADVRKGMTVGADDYLCKPVVVSDLLNSIQTRLARRQAQVAREQGRVRQWAADFGRVLSHELRTPLGVIGPSLELLDQVASENSLEEVREVSQFAQSGASRLGEAVKRVELYVSLAAPKGADPVARGTWSGAPSEVVIALAGAEVAEKWHRASDLRLELDRVTLGVDAEYFLPSIRELLDNAFKFSKAGTQVTVGLRVAGDRVQFTVTDAGCGMTAEQIAEVTAFRQFGRSEREQQGLGIGLAIATRLAERMQGRLLLRPNPTGGLTAQLELPLTPNTL